MSMVSVNNFLLSSALTSSSNALLATVNAAGKSGAIVGYVRIPGNATGKVLSAAGGGSIWWATEGSVTFANAGTTLRIGLQDVDTSTGLEDGTFDVYREYVGATDTLASSRYFQAMMGSGTKTLSDGDLIAIVGEMPTRGGADSVTLHGLRTTAFSNQTAVGLPYGTVDTGTLTKTANAALWAIIQFDDGTLGWIQGVQYNTAAESATVAFGSGSSPNEYLGAFTLPFNVQVCGIGVDLNSLSSSDPFDLTLFRDPYGTPSAVQVVSVDPDLNSGSGSVSRLVIVPITPVTLTAGTEYGISTKPTSANTLGIFWVNYGSSGVSAVIKATTPFTALSVGSRSGGSGAFSVVSADYLPVLALDVCGLEPGGAGSAVEVGYPFGG